MDELMNDLMEKPGRTDDQAHMTNHAGASNDAGRTGAFDGSYANPLDFIFHARSIALVGVSTDPRKMTGAPLGILRQTSFKGEIYPVNPKATEIGGLRAYPSIDSLPHAPDVAMIMLAAKHCAQAVRITQAPIGTIKPVSSARPMNCTGGTRPSSGWFQRINASMPTLRPLLKSTWGW